MLFQGAARTIRVSGIAEMKSPVGIDLLAMYSPNRSLIHTSLVGQYFASKHLRKPVPHRGKATAKFNSICKTALKMLF